MPSNNSKVQGRSSLATLSVHGGLLPEDQHRGAVVPPVFHSATYRYGSFAELRRYARGELPDRHFYSRNGNPTTAEVERRLAGLEGAEDCVVTSSGSAATFAALAAICEAGDEVIASDSIYGGTLKIVTKLLSRFGIRSRLIAIDDIPRLAQIASERTRVLWFETPTNPLNRLVDLNRAAAAARAASVFSIADNTFATPILQRPLANGIDAVMHSATKYLAGHSDLIAGAVAGSSDFIRRAREMAVTIGATLDPGAAYLLARGIKTLDLRVRASCANALRLAETLQGHQKVQRVYYPGLKSDPHHELAGRQMSAFGGVVAFDLAGGEPEVERFFDSLRLIQTAPSLGGVETLASYPIYSSHASYTAEQLQAAGVSSATVRLAVGIEAAEDLIGDVMRALESV